MHELVLGTAQWGNDYGVTNPGGRLSDDDVAGIARLAISRSIVWVDTAASYGDAQARLRPWSSNFCITSKVSGADPQEIRRQVRACINELGRDSIDACLIHDWDSLDKGTRRAAAARLEDLREQGLTDRVGVSVYDEEALQGAADHFDRLDVAQVPANVLDRRLEDSKLPADLASTGTRIQVRSVLLQGLLAGPSPTTLSKHPDVSAFFDWCRETGTPPLTLALAHVRSLPWAAQILMGVTSARELKQILDAWAVPAKRIPGHIASSDQALIDPRTWPSLPAL